MEIKVFVFNAFYENTLVVYNQTDAIVIDPGCYDEREFNELMTFIQNEDLRVHAIVNTHGHIDHVLGNYRLKEVLKVPLYAPENEKETIKSVEVYAPMYGIQNYTPATVDHWMKEFDEVTFGSLSFEIMEVPGHSPGHQVLYNKAQKILIGGDVLFRESIGRTDLPGGNHDQLLEEIKDKLYTLPDDVTVYPGHGPETTIGHEKKYNPFVRI